MWFILGLALAQGVDPGIAGLVQEATLDLEVVPEVVLDLVHLIIKEVVVALAPAINVPGLDQGPAADLTLKRTEILAVKIKQLCVNISIVSCFVLTTGFVKTQIKLIIPNKYFDLI